MGIMKRPKFDGRSRAGEGNGYDRQKNKMMFNAKVQLGFKL